jgi:hypothetical protein
MSELFIVSVASVTPKSAKLIVKSVHPDSGPVVGTATFALQLIYDPIMSSSYGNLTRWKHLEIAALAAEMDSQSYLDPKWIQDNAQAFIAKAKATKETLEIFPTDPAWIAHLRAGMKWDTAAYDQGAGKKAKPRLAGAAKATTASRDPKAGFRVGAPKNADYKLKTAFIPLFGANRYVADPLLNTPSEIASALPKMTGLPIRVTFPKGPPEVGTVGSAADTWLSLYVESDGGWSSRGVRYEQIKDVGRAWLKVEVPKGKSAAKPARKAAPKKKATKPARK